MNDNEVTIFAKSGDGHITFKNVTHLNIDKTGMQFHYESEPNQRKTVCFWHKNIAGFAYTLGMEIAE